MKVGIALAAYRPIPSVFAEQLLSIQNQTYENWICVVTFDSPLDQIRTAPELEAFFSDPRFIWSENKVRLGHKKNFEKAIQQATSFNVDAIACSDQDDIWYPDKLSACVEALKAQGKLSLVHSDMHVLKDGKILDKTAWTIERRGIGNSKSTHLMIRNIVAGCSMLFDAELARRYPIIPEGVEFHDHWYALVAAYHGGIGAIHRPLYAYRQHVSNEVGVSPFYRIFYIPPGLNPLLILKKCRKGWKKSRALAHSATQNQLPIRAKEKILFAFPFDLGLGVLLLGLINFLKDPPLARACFARGIGKALFFIEPRETPPFREG